MSGLETIKLLHYGKCNDIFLAKDSTGNQFALKRFYRQELEKRKEYVNKDGKLVKKDWFEDFKRALEVQKVLDHESCIKLHDIFGVDFTPEEPTFEEEIDLVFEYAEFGSLMRLESFQEEVPNFPKPVIKCIAKDVLNALLYLSKINVAHRDLKPSNIFMNSHGRCKLGDFGESEFMSEDGKVKGSRGTYYFLAPEVFNDNSNENDGGAIDMWALGITLWILYFKSFPFYCPSGSIYETMTNIQNFNFNTQIQSLKLVNSPENAYNSVEKSTELREDLGNNYLENLDAQEFINLLEKILEKDPKKRIKPEEALNHEWLRNVDYEAAREFCSQRIKK